jgi:hypothetical protein
MDRNMYEQTVAVGLAKYVSNTLTPLVTMFVCSEFVEVAVNNLGSHSCTSSKNDENLSTNGAADRFGYRVRHHTIPYSVANMIPFESNINSNTAHEPQSSNTS